MRIGIVLQARMGSTRLPGKVLRPLGGHPILWHIVNCLRQSKRADSLILATTIADLDAPIREFAKREGILLFAGSEGDVLDRYYQAARAFQLDHIVRCTGDNPLVDPSMLDNLIDLHLSSGADLTHSKTDKGNALPVGVGAEVFTVRALERSWREGRSAHHREHIDEYIQEHPDQFRIVNLPVPRQLSCPGLRLTVDTPQDYERMLQLYDTLYVPERTIDLAQAIRWCVLQGWDRHA